jgi:hypothetical protein
MLDRLKPILVETLPRQLLVDLYDMSVSRALAAFEMIRDHAGLDPKRAREAEGQVRFRMQEKGFHETCELYGGNPLEDGLIPGSDLRVFQPFMRFQGPKLGVILGLASMPERGKIPIKNQSRGAGVTLNYDFPPRLDFDGKGPKASDVFVLFLVARDPNRAGRVEEVAVGLINSEYKDFVFYRAIEEMIGDYADDGVRDEGDAAASAPLVKLKPKTVPFVAPETPQADDDKTADR